MDKPTGLLIVDRNIDFTAVLAEINRQHPISRPRFWLLSGDVSDGAAWGHPISAVIASSFGNIENRITFILHRIGFPAHIRGFPYARKSIAIVMEDRGAIDAVTKLLYPCVARAYHTTPSCVERAIRHAIEVAWNRSMAETLHHVFGCFIERKPTNSEFIALIAEYLLRQSDE